MGLYHYTTELRLTKIFETEYFKPSSNTQFDSTYGEGWYLTDLPPFTCDYVLMGALWERTTLHQRVKNYVEVEVIGTRAIKKRDHVYFVPKSANVTFRAISRGDAPLCCPDRTKCLNRPSNYLRALLLNDSR